MPSPPRTPPLSLRALGTSQDWRAGSCGLVGPGSGSAQASQEGASVRRSGPASKSRDNEGDQARCGSRRGRGGGGRAGGARDAPAAAWHIVVLGHNAGGQVARLAMGTLGDPPGASQLTPVRWPKSRSPRAAGLHVKRAEGVPAALTQAMRRPAAMPGACRDWRLLLSLAHRPGHSPRARRGPGGQTPAPDECLTPPSSSLRNLLIVASVISPHPRAFALSAAPSPWYLDGSRR